MSLQQASKWEEKLLHEPFSTIAFFPPQNQQFYFKLVAETILLTNFEHAWLCCCDEKKIASLAEEYTPHLSMKPAELVKYIQDQFFGSFEKTKFELFIPNSSSNAMPWKTVHVKVHAILQLAAHVALPFEWTLTCELMVQMHDVIVLDASQQQSYQQSSSLQDHTTCIRYHAIEPLLAMVSALQFELSQLRQAAQDAVKSNHTGKLANVLQEQEKPKKKHHFTSFLPFSKVNQSQHLIDLYRGFQDYVQDQATPVHPNTLAQADAIPSATPTPRNASQPFLQGSNPFQDSQDSQQSSNSSHHSKQSTQVLSQSVTIIPSASPTNVDDQVPFGSPYEESVNEKKRRLEIEEERAAKKQRKDKQDEKKKIKRAFF